MNLTNVVLRRLLIRWMDEDVLIIPTSLSLPLSLSPGKVFRLRRPTTMPLQIQTSKKAASLQTYNMGIEGSFTPVSQMFGRRLCSHNVLRVDFSCLSDVCHCRSKNSSQQTCDPTVNTGSGSYAGGSQCRAVSSIVFGF